jgi:hypothetical protein
VQELVAVVLEVVHLHILHGVLQLVPATTYLELGIMLVVVEATPMDLVVMAVAAQLVM